MSRANTASKARADRKRPNQPPPSGTGRFPTGGKLIASLSVLLAAATIALYSPVLGHSFLVYDDQGYVTANPHLRPGLAWSTLTWAFTTNQEGHWHPLTWLSHALDYQLFALNPVGHHFDSVLIHALNAVLLFLLLTWATKRVGPSLLVAALFAVHPLNVESVAWVAERKNALSTLFFLLAIAAYVRYARAPDWRRYVLVAALFAAALMAKPSVIILPFVLLLLDYWPLSRPAGSLPAIIAAPQFPISRLLLEKVPLLLLSAASALMTINAQRSPMAVGGLHQLPLWIRLENAVVCYGLYLWKTIWPARLAALYPYPANSFPIWQVTLSALVLAAVTVLVIVFRRKRYLLVGWLWFLGTAIPVIGLVPIVGAAVMADRYVYVPLIGIFLMIAWGLDDWTHAKKIPPAWYAWQAIPALCVLSVLSLVTLRQMSYWDSDYDLWSHAAEVTTLNPVAQNGLAEALMNPDVAMTAENRENLDTPEKRMDEARQHHEEALKIYRQLAQQDPNASVADMVTTLNNLANLDLSQKRPEEARRRYLEALRISRQPAQPDLNTNQHLAMTLNNLGSLDRSLNRLDEARKDWEEALKIDRQLAQQNLGRSYLTITLNNLASLDLSEKRFDEARECYEEELEAFRQLAQQDPQAYLPNMAATLKDLGTLDGLQNRMDEAGQHFEEALKLYRLLAQQDLPQQNEDAHLPDMAATLNNLAVVDLRQNRADEARECYQEALKAYRQLAQQDPDTYLPRVAGILSALGFLDRNQNRIGESQAHYQEALTLWQKLSQGDGRYAAEAARTAASLEALGAPGPGAPTKKAPSR